MRKIKRRKEKNKKRIIVISLFLFLIIMTSGYAAFSTNISLHAKGNIKCNPKNIQDKILKDLTTEGDGLYKDEYTEGRYIYRGANPDNYIKFNSELWRIISLENDEVIKIIKSNAINDMAWDEQNSNDWLKPATINIYLNESYYESLSEESQNLIITHNWEVGMVSSDNDNMQLELQEEEKKTWNGKIGLISHSEYLRANSNIKLCGTDKKNDENHITCNQTNWLYSLGLYWWTISGRIDSNFLVWDVNGGGTFSDAFPAAGNENHYRYVFPVLHLSKDIKICGEGTHDNPYIIKN